MSATPLQRIFPQFLAMIAQFYGTGKAATAIIAAAAATADSLTVSSTFFLIEGIAGR
jgi:purine nucleoside permease